MSSRQNILISKFLAHLSKIEGVSAIALVGSRGARDRTKIDRYSDADFLILCDDKTREYLIKKLESCFQDYFHVNCIYLPFLRLNGYPGHAGWDHI